MHNFKKKQDIAEALFSKGRGQKKLFDRARRTRNEVFSNKVEVRSVIEYSNICRQACNYCGMSRESGLKRYIMSDDETTDSIKRLYGYGRRVLIIQSGEFHSEHLFENLLTLIKRMKENFPGLTIMGSFGNLSLPEYKIVKEAGVERYLLKFETSDSKLYKKVKPSDSLFNRLRHLEILKKTGFKVSSGNITGLPGQSVESLAEDLLLLKRLRLFMGSTSAFIPNDMSNYANWPSADINLVLNFMAILRILCPTILIPATSSLELLVKDGQYLGLMSGANVVTLHDGTPKNDEKNFVLYKKDRYKPKDVLLEIVARAGLKHSFDPLI